VSNSWACPDPGERPGRPGLRVPTCAEKSGVLKREKRAPATPAAGQVWVSGPAGGLVNRRPEPLHVGPLAAQALTHALAELFDAILRDFQHLRGRPSGHANQTASGLPRWYPSQHRPLEMDQAEDALVRPVVRHAGETLVDT